MRINTYSLFDIKAEYYSYPFKAQNDETAKRMVKNNLQDPQNNQTEYVQNPEDFILFKIGGFDDANGKVESEVKELISLKELVKTQED